MIKWIRSATLSFLRSANLYFHKHDHCLTRRAGGRWWSGLRWRQVCVRACVRTCVREHVRAPGDSLNEQKQLCRPNRCSQSPLKPLLLCRNLCFGFQVCVCETLFENVKNVQVWQKPACNRGPVITTAFDNRGFSFKWCWKWDTRLFWPPYHYFFHPCERRCEETMQESALLLYVWARWKIIYRGERAEIINRCQGWTIPTSVVFKFFDPQKICPGFGFVSTSSISL